MKLGKMQKLCNEATEGPWILVKARDICTSDIEELNIAFVRNTSFCTKQERSNAKFIAASRTLLPKLLAVAAAVKELPWGKVPFLPVCLESFPKLHEALEELENE